MIEFNIKNQEYKIADITIKQFYDIQTLLVTEGMKAKLEIISLLSGAPTKELQLLDQTEFIYLWNAVADGPLNHKEDLQLYKHIIVNEKLYGFMEFSKMSIGEFADMEVLKQDPMKASKLHIMMAILYRPATQITGDWIVTEEYNGDTVMERAEIFKDMPLKYVYGALNFFLLVQKYLLNSMMDSLTQEVMEIENLIPEAEKKALYVMMHLISELQEAGQTPSTDWQETISRNSKMLQELVQSMSSITWPTEKTSTRKNSKPVKRLNLEQSIDKINQ